MFVYNFEQTHLKLKEMQMKAVNDIFQLPQDPKCMWEINKHKLDNKVVPSRQLKVFDGKTTEDSSFFFTSCLYHVTTTPLWAHI